MFSRLHQVSASNILQLRSNTAAPVFRKLPPETASGTLLFVHNLVAHGPYSGGKVARHAVPALIHTFRYQSCYASSRFLPNGDVNPDICTSGFSNRMISSKESSAMGYFDRIIASQMSS